MTVKVTYKWEKMPWLTAQVNSPMMVNALESAAEEVRDMYWHSYEAIISTSAGGWPAEPTVLLIVYDRKPRDDPSGAPEFHRKL
jgi:hypothetical protein